jgi:hypothetical protein
MQESGCTAWVVCSEEVKCKLCDRACNLGAVLLAQGNKGPRSLQAARCLYSGMTGDGERERQAGQRGKLRVHAGVRVQAGIHIVCRGLASLYGG